VSPNPYAGSGQGVAQLRTIKASRQWGKRHYNLTGATCSPVTITDRHAVMAGERNLSPDLTEAEQDAILAQLRANAPKREKAFNIHDK
jgi:hypothetical protein